MSRKKRRILTAKELEAQRAAGPASNRGFLRSLVASVARPAQRSAADTLAALRAEVFIVLDWVLVFLPNVSSSFSQFHACYCRSLQVSISICLTSCGLSRNKSMHSGQGTIGQLVSRQHRWLRLCSWCR